MSESSYGVITVIILFTICMLLSFAIILLKSMYRDKPVKKEAPPKVFYITESKKPKRKPAKKTGIPLNATIIKAEELKKYLDEMK